MNRVIRQWAKICCFAIGVLPGDRPALAGMVYDNTDNYLGEYYRVPNEFGDQIQLAGNPLERLLTQFKFGYFLSPASGGNEMAELRFYQNDGAQGTPRTLLYDSGWFNLIPGFNTVSVDGIGVEVPDTFTWTVRFSGIEPGEDAGLLFCDPPATGSSRNDFWEQTSENHWTRVDLSASGGPPANFGAQVMAEILPTRPLPTLALDRIGGDLVLNYWLQNTQGLIIIFQSDRLETLRTGGKPVYSGPIPPTRQGTLVLTHALEAPCGFFSLAEYSAASNPDSTNLVWIAPGTFTLGSPEGENDRFPDEGPQNQVALSRGFWMGKHEVTQEQFQAVTGTNPSEFKGDAQRPVEKITWQEAVNYCARLTEREREAGRLPAGLVYRLPTEAEWEYAARAGTTTPFSFGTGASYAEFEANLWFEQNSASTTHPVENKQPNPWGLFDMHGNVWEWCRDWYAPYPGGQLRDPTGPITGSFRVARGGGWSSRAGFCRSAIRLSIWPDDRYDLLGFRVVVAAMDTE